MSLATDAWEPPLPEFRVWFRLRGGTSWNQRQAFLVQLAGEGPVAPEESEVDSAGAGWSTYAAAELTTHDRDRVDASELRTNV